MRWDFQSDDSAVFGQVSPDSTWTFSPNASTNKQYAELMKRHLSSVKSHSSNSPLTSRKGRAGLAKAILNRLMRVLPRKLDPISLAVDPEPDQINAGYQLQAKDKRTIVITVTQAALTKLSTEALAFLLAHELGHALDDTAPSQRSSIAELKHKLLSTRDLRLLRSLQMGESAADFRGVELLLRAGLDVKGADEFFSIPAAAAFWDEHAPHEYRRALLAWYRTFRQAGTAGAAGIGSISGASPNVR